MKNRYVIKRTMIATTKNAPTTMNSRTIGPVAEPVPQEPVPPKGPDRPVEDVLADQIMTGAHTPEQLQRARILIEAMLTLEQVAQGKSPEELAIEIQE